MNFLPRQTPARSTADPRPISPVRTRRAAILQGLAVVALGLLISAEAAGPSLAAETLRIGYQRSSTLIAILKANGELEKALVPLGVTITWHEFSSGLPLLEAINVGSIDVGADVADTVPIFAQAAGAKLAYVAEEAASPSARAILVPTSSPLKSVAELKPLLDSSAAGL